MASRTYMRKRKAIASMKGRLGVIGRQRKMLEDASKVYSLVRTIEFRMADGSVAATWRVFATHDPHAPLAVDFGTDIRRYISLRRLSPLIARKMFDVVGP